LKPGAKLILCDGIGFEALVQIDKPFKDGFVADIVEIKKNNTEPKINVILYCSILKRQNFEFVVQKATEIGIRNIVPLICRNTVKKKIKKDRIERIVKEAFEQSGRGLIPKIAETTSFREALEISKINDRNIALDQSGNYFKNLQETKNKSIGLFIGPEGGWANSELDILKDRDLELVSLGDLTLRAETAAVIASYLGINYLL
jgi:16S rRNA (uracil1498-N3)-methyltransferase